MVFEKYLTPNSQTIGALDTPGKAMTTNTQNMAKVHTKKSGDGESSAKKSRSVNPTGKYITLGLKALSQWKPGKITVMQPIAQVIDMFCGCGGMSLGFAAMAKARSIHRQANCC